jgi:hypothetical protein
MRPAEGLLARWTYEYVASSWMARWTVAPFDQGPTTAAPRMSVLASTERLAFRPHLSQYESRVDVTLAHQLTGPIGLRLSGSSGSSRTLRSGRPVIESPRSESVALGVEATTRVARLGTLQALVMPGWDRGPGGLARVSARGDRHAFALSAWSVRSRHSRVVLPTDSARAVGEGKRAHGARVDLRGRLTYGPVEIRPGVAWRRERLRADAPPADAYLGTSPEGRSQVVQWTLGADIARFGLDLAYGDASLDLASTIRRSGQPAGRLSYGRLNLEHWRAGVRLDVGTYRWSATLGREHVVGELSARVETWPFAGFWESISVQAYRFDAAVHGEGTILRVAVAPSSRTGWMLASQLARYVVVTDRDSWLVTGFGFGRRDRETQRAGVDPVYFVGTTVRRSVDLPAGLLTIDAQASVPVHYRPIGADAPATELRWAGIPGHLRFSVGWAW